MKALKSDNLLVCYFATFLVRYGKITQTGIYKIEVSLPLKKWLGYHKINIYIGKTKPKFHNLYIIGALWFPFYTLLLLLVPLLMTIFFIFTILFSFYYNCLFRKSFITDWLDTLSGYISLILSIIGVIALIRFFI